MPDNSMTRKAVHLIAASSGGTIETKCGLRGQRTVTDGHPDSYCNRYRLFKASAQRAKVTCSECLGVKRNAGRRGGRKPKVARKPNKANHERRSWSVKAEKSVGELLKGFLKEDAT